MPGAQSRKSISGSAAAPAHRCGAVTTARTRRVKMASFSGALGHLVADLMKFQAKSRVTARGPKARFPLHDVVRACHQLTRTRLRIHS